MAAAACGPYPRDVEGTLGTIHASGAMRVAFGHIPVSQRPRAEQFAARIAKAAAARLQRVEFGSDEAMFAALETGGVDLVLTEIADDSPWATEVAVTEPIAIRRVGERKLGVSAVARNGENRWIMLLEREARNMASAQ